MRELKMSLLLACLDLPLTGPEKALIREIHLAYARDVIAEWGATNSTREQEVADLFEKCKKLLKEHVS